jgi:hypothetical protein
MRGLIYSRLRGVFQIIALVLLYIFISGCAPTALVGGVMPTSSSTEFENPNPLRISKEEANNIKVVAITTFPLHTAMLSPMMTVTSMQGTLNPVSFLTESIKNKGRFEVIPPNEFRKKLMESNEMFDKSLTQDEVYIIAQRVGRSLGADAVIVIEMESQRGEGSLMAQAMHTGFTGRATQVQPIKMHMISADSRKVIWDQSMKSRVTHGLNTPGSDDIIRGAITPLVDNLHASF